MAKQVNLYVIRRNTFEHDYLQKTPVNADNAYVETTQWRVPVIVDGRLEYFKYVADGAKPSDDSVKVLRIVDKGNNELFYAVIPDTSSAQAWVDSVNACCDGPVDMPNVTMPDIFIEETGCADDSGNYTYFTYTQALVGAQVYVAAASKNGSAQPALSAAGYTTLGALVTAAAAAWTGYDSVTNPSGTKFQIVADDAVTGSVSVEVRNYFESGADAALASGDHYTLEATINGVALPKITGVVDGALATIAVLANANPAWSMFGKYSVVANKIRLVAYSNVSTATLTLTEVAP